MHNNVYNLLSSVLMFVLHVHLLTVSCSQLPEDHPALPHLNKRKRQTPPTKHITNPIAQSCCYCSQHDECAKVLDILEYAPAVIEHHCHNSLWNNLKYRQSLKLRAHYELLAETIESLGKICISSGLIPSLRRGSGLFSRLHIC